MRIISTIEDQEVIDKIFRHLVFGKLLLCILGKDFFRMARNSLSPKEIQGMNIYSFFSRRGTRTKTDFFGRATPA